jgi:LCP family protein required for cell wall assembly
MFNDGDRSVSRRALYLLQGLVLVIVLVLTTVVTRWMLAPAPETASSPPATPATTVAPASPSPTPSPSPTATSTPTPSSTPTSTATPPPPTIVRATPAFTVSVHGTPAALSIPTPVPQVELADGVINVVLLGADQETIGNGALRTDVIVVASIDPEGPYVSLLSIPRDLYLWIPGQEFGKINTAYGGRRDFPAGGPSLVEDTIEYNLGIPIDFYALVDFAGFVQIVDALGGVDVPVECELHDTFPNPVRALPLVHARL